MHTCSTHSPLSNLLHLGVLSCGITHTDYLPWGRNKQTYIAGERSAADIHTCVLTEMCNNFCVCHLWFLFSLLCLCCCCSTPCTLTFREKQEECTSISLSLSLSLFFSLTHSHSPSLPLSLSLSLSLLTLPSPYYPLLSTITLHSPVDTGGFSETFGGGVGGTSSFFVARGLGGISGAGLDPGGWGAGRTGSRGANVSWLRAGRDDVPEPSLIEQV